MPLGRRRKQPTRLQVPAQALDSEATADGGGGGGGEQRSPASDFSSPVSSPVKPTREESSIREATLNGVVQLTRAPPPAQLPAAPPSSSSSPSWRRRNRLFSSSRQPDPPANATSAVNSSRTASPSASQALQTSVGRQFGPGSVTMPGLFSRKRNASTTAPAKQLAVTSTVSPTPSSRAVASEPDARPMLDSNDAERTSTAPGSDDTSRQASTSNQDLPTSVPAYATALFYGMDARASPRSRANTGTTSSRSRHTQSPDSIATSNTSLSRRSSSSSQQGTPPTSCSETLASPPSGTPLDLHNDGPASSSSFSDRDRSLSTASRSQLLSLSDSGGTANSSGFDLVATASGSRAPYTPPIQVRRLTNNSLSLPNLPRASPPMPPANLPPVAPFEEQAQTQNLTSTQRRMRTLPRLLSSDAYTLPSSNAIRSGQVVVEEDGESESDTEEADTGESQDDDSDMEESTEDGHVRQSEQDAVQTIRNARLHVTPGATPRDLSPASVSGRTVQANTNWVTFAPVTPTPHLARSTRPTDGSQPTDSYFDIRRPTPASTTTTTTARTPGQPLMTPLIPQSFSNSARGRRPVHQDELATAASPTPASNQQSSSENPSGLQSAHYRLRSQSAVVLTSPSVEVAPSPTTTRLDPVWQAPDGPATPGPNFLRSPETPRLDVKQQQPSSSPARATPPVSPGQAGHRLERRRSMYELPTNPPAYHAVYSRSGQQQVVYPREEEGQEPLPDYTCAIHFEGYLPRKMEFTSPGNQAKDRSWKRVYMVLHGTSIKFYKYDLRTHPIPGEENWSSLTIDMAGSDGPPPLHFHPGDYMASAEDTNQTNHKFPTSIGDARAKAKSKIVQATSSSDHNVLIRHYSLQNAESGLAADYIKRKHVVRVRAEGEQFLLQTNGDRGTIDLIEVLQAATNVSLDLDCRPLPKFITLPRRRRRRRRVDANVSTSAATGADAASSGPTNAAAPSSTRDEDRMGDMLAEEQQAYAAAGAGASTV
ncbi:hypothetical protein ACM66B_003753 [Microbotryomycetes sp. NB124-2]